MRTVSVDRAGPIRLIALGRDVDRHSVTGLNTPHCTLTRSRSQVLHSDWTVPQGAGDRRDARPGAAEPAANQSNPPASRGDGR
jgi:hypothetical protein